MVPFAILIYIAALCAANLLAHHFGSANTPYIAFTLVGLDLSIRDWLNVVLPRWGMAILIPAAGATAYLIDPGVRFIATASVISFVISEWVEWGCFTWTRGTWLSRSIRSNTVAAAVDSLIFPALAFHAWLPLICLAQFAAKTVGSSLWAFGLQFIPMRRRA
jgi:uncharacterized PurR-regulated membrane protein YhhQ (DUF165 family)